MKKGAKASAATTPTAARPQAPKVAAPAARADASPVAQTPRVDAAKRPDASARADAAPRADVAARAATHEEIARRAYAHFLARGGAHGHALDDWYRAERELAR